MQWSHCVFTRIALAILKEPVYNVIKLLVVLYRKLMKYELNFQNGSNITLLAFIIILNEDWWQVVD